MNDVLTALQMREVEAQAITSGAVTGLELMERAGLCVVDAIGDEWPVFAETAHRAVVLCGPGNNGGDGFVIARLLRERGWSVEVFVFGDADKLPPDARVNYDRWRAVGAVAQFKDWAGRSWNCDLVIDALFGTGLTRGLPALGDLFRNMDDMVGCFEVKPGHGTGHPAIVAVDIPSGLCADSGRWFPNAQDHHRFAARAHLTVTFHRPKLGHFLAQGPEACGKLVVGDIGLKDVLARPERVALANQPSPSRTRKTTGAHKFSHGSALVLSGGPGRTGAARLAARGALRVGAGLVTLGVPPSAQLEVASQVTALMLKRVADAAALAKALEDDRINALCIGPGLGLDARAGALVDTAIASLSARIRRHLVLDADALTWLAQDAAHMQYLNERCILTPHGGEFARLFPDIAQRLQASPWRGPAMSKVDAAREAAARCGAIVLFKGPDTVIAHPLGRVVLNAAVYDRAAPWLATAGAGDVLAGFITGLLARGLDPMNAACVGAWLHVECARAFGPGLIAEDLPEMLPQVLRVLND